MEPHTYNLLTVEETTFEPDKYGNKYYSVSFEGVQGKALWKTKARPNTGPVFGHFEKSQSGKATIFKKDQKPDDYVAPAFTAPLTTNMSAVVPDWFIPYGKLIQSIHDELHKPADKLTLKDKNGVEIYEGDILKTNYYPHEDKVFYVEYLEWAGAYEAIDNHKDGYGLSNMKWEVIGNIYENSDLLEE